MSSKNLIITSGASQLLTQISALQFLGQDLSHFDIIYIGDQSERLSVVLAAISSKFELNFVGSIANLKMLSTLRQGRGFNFLLSLIFNAKRLRESVFLLYPKLRLYRNSFIVIPVRHKMLSDVILLHALNPSKLLLTADGVVNIVAKRDFNSLRWYGVNTELNMIPSKNNIYAPFYLKDEVDKLGDFVEIPNEIFKSILLKTSTQLYFEKAVLYFKTTKFNAIVFSQHLSLTYVCSLDEEIKFYKKLVDDLISKNIFPILIKPHPREQNSKIVELKRRLSTYNDKVYFLPLDWTAIPIEILTISKKIDNLVTLNSSAPLGILSMGSNILCYSSHLFTLSYQEEIKAFALDNNAKLTNI
jgi:hypothetical protein